MNNYILGDDGKTPVPCPDILKWATWFEDTDHVVAQTKRDDVVVSTVFLGINHQFIGGPPKLFETMVLGLGDENYMRRYSTWEEAEAGHREVCREVWPDIL